jgi:hypothetical protein
VRVPVWGIYAKTTVHCFLDSSMGGSVRAYVSPSNNDVDLAF